MNPALLAGALAACLLLAAPQAVASEPPQIEVGIAVDLHACVRIVWEEFPYVFLDECPGEG